MKIPQDKYLDLMGQIVATLLTLEPGLSIRALVSEADLIVDQIAEKADENYPALRNEF